MKVILENNELYTNSMNNIMAAFTLPPNHTNLDVRFLNASLLLVNMSPFLLLTN